MRFLFFFQMGNVCFKPVIISYTKILFYINNGFPNVDLERISIPILESKFAVENILFCLNWVTK